jgi:hypothetical protein
VFQKRAGIALLLLVAGCGGGDADEPAPVTNLNREPRVEGRFRVAYTPAEGGETQRAIWRTQPICDAGPCAFTIVSDAGARYSFEYDEATKEWTGRDRQSMDCVADKGDKVLQKNAYVVRSRITLTPVLGVKAGKTTFVTEMAGDRVDENALTEEGFARGCRDAAGEEGAIRLVRVNPPPGRQRRIAPSIEDALGQ